MVLILLTIQKKNKIIDIVLHLGLYYIPFLTLNPTHRTGFRLSQFFLQRHLGLCWVSGMTFVTPWGRVELKSSTETITCKKLQFSSDRVKSRKIVQQANKYKKERAEKSEVWVIRWGSNRQKTVRKKTENEHRGDRIQLKWHTLRSAGVEEGVGTCGRLRMFEGELMMW